MKKKLFLMLAIASGFLHSGCANIKLVSSNNNQHKFCTNPNNQVAKESDFDEAAAKKCDGQYRFLNGGLEFFTDPNTPKLFGVLEVQKERQMCRIYECTK